MRDMEGWRGEVVKPHMSHSSEVLPPGQWAVGEVTPTPNLSRGGSEGQERFGVGVTSPTAHWPGGRTSELCGGKLPPSWKQDGEVLGCSPHHCLLSLHEASGTLRGCQCPDTRPEVSRVWGWWLLNWVLGWWRRK